MSYDLGVWFPHRRFSDEEAGNVYSRLCDSNISDVQPHPAVESFYNELTSMHPEIDTIPEERIDDHDYCPWSCALDYSPAHVIMPCVWSQAENVHNLVYILAAKWGLAVYNPQDSNITYPPQMAAVPAKRPWWKLW